MTVRGVTYYEVVCDEPGCGATSGTEGGDFSAWSDAGAAEDDWTYSSQTLPDGRHYCHEHRRPECVNCDETNGLHRDANDEWACDDCDQGEGA